MPSNSERGAYVVALTGGIASGKSAVSERFQKLGVPVIDTDLIARELVKPSQPLLSSIITAFGSHLLDTHGRLIRKKLRDIVFTNKEKRAELEAIMHPAIRKDAIRQIESVDAPYCILVIPLLVESGGFPGIDHVLAIDVLEETQITRLMKRDGIDREAAQKILGIQANRQQRLSIADDILFNEAPLDLLDAKVSELHTKFLSLANQERN